MTPSTAVALPHWPSIVQEICDGKPSGFEALYQGLAGFRSRFSRRVGVERSEDLYHDLILRLVNQIRGGQLRNPLCLPGYAKIMADRQVMASLKTIIHQRNAEVQADDVQVRDTRESVESGAIDRENQDIAKRMLAAMPERDREVLIRFYLNGESQEQIQLALNLTKTQYRLIKSRAKSRFTELSRRRLQCRGAGSAVRVNIPMC
jgi:RNA polymerase sigma factor (sigma-70 family)